MKPIFGRGKSPTEKDPTPVNFDARPPTRRGVEMAVEKFDQHAGGQDTMEHFPSAFDPRFDPFVQELNRKLDILLAERETTNKGIAAIKQIVAGLTYGEMVELRDQLEKHVPNIGNSEATAAIVKALPEMFHAWATS